MPVQIPDSAESIRTILTCNSDEFWDSFNDQTLQTDVLSNVVVKKIIHRNSERLRTADKRYRLDLLLSVLLDHAPHPLGKRYIAVCLDIANEKGHDGVVNAARVWMHLPSSTQSVCLFSSLCLLTTKLLMLRSVLAASRVINKLPASNQTSSTESASEAEMRSLRKKVSIVPLLSL